MVAVAGIFLTTLPSEQQCDIWKQERDVVFCVCNDEFQNRISGNLDEDGSLV